MNAQDVKEYIVINDKIEYILEDLGCHSIKLHDNRYYSCGFPDGDNKGALNIYIDTLKVVSYTRNISEQNSADIISLVCYIKQVHFSHGLKYLTDTLGLDYYSDIQGELPSSLSIGDELLNISNGLVAVKRDILKPISEKVLGYYLNVCNKLFLKDNISYETQREFEVGFDLQTLRYTIPIRDDLGTLVGVKGRYYKKETNEEKYIYLEPCSKSQVLYGLNKTIEYIKDKQQVIVVESEKSVMLLWEQGIRNVVAASGHSLSRTQVEKITRLGISEIILCYDYLA